MNEAPLLPGVTADPYNNINPNAEAYWIDSSKDAWIRINKVRGNTTVDKDVSWVPARMSNFVRHQRGIIKQFFRKNLNDDTILHPNGSEVSEIGNQSRGIIFSILDMNLDLNEEISKRVSGHGVKIPISQSKLYFEGPNPRRLHLPEGEMSVENAQEFYNVVCGEILAVANNYRDHLSTQDLHHLRTLHAFYCSRVQWADMQLDKIYPGPKYKPDTGLMAVIDPDSKLRATQNSLLSLEEYPLLGQVITVNPQRTTKITAMTLMVHHLSLLRDYVIAHDASAHLTGDKHLDALHRGVSTSLALMRALSRNTIQPIVENFVSHGQYRSKSDGSTVRQEYERITQQPPSETAMESQMRDTLFAFMTMFEVARQNSGGDPEKRGRMERNFVKGMFTQ